MSIFERRRTLDIIRATISKESFYEISPLKITFEDVPPAKITLRPLRIESNNIKIYSLNTSK